jgi:AcrR family transcriptional regulator
MAIDERRTSGVAQTDSDRREELLQAASRAIGRKGIDSVRLLDVAREAGVSIGALQHHFETRDALIVEAVEAIARLTAKSAVDASASTDDPWDSLVAVIGSLTPTDDPRLDAATWMELCAVASRQPEYRPAVQLVQDHWRAVVLKIVKRGVRDGSFTLSLSAKETVEAILALADGVQVTAASELQEVSRAQVQRRVLAAAAVLLGRST